jgi:AcrR family transcriptional regulator
MKRIRRSAEEARNAILDAAERRLIQSGPAGIRLQEVAAEAGMSHPTVLHHFGSREGLVKAAVERLFRTLDASVISALAEVSTDESGAEVLLNRLADALRRGGHARALAWLTLADYPHDQRGEFEIVVDAVHEKRIAACIEKGQPKPSREDSLFTVLLTSFTLLGEALVGRRLYESVGRDEAKTAARFRAWLGKQLLEHLDQKK